MVINCCFLRYRFGWFYKRNDTASDGDYEVYTGTDDLKKLGQMYAWKDDTNLTFYEGSCSRSMTSYRTM